MAAAAARRHEPFRRGRNGEGRYGPIQDVGRNCPGKMRGERCGGRRGEVEGAKVVVVVEKGDVFRSQFVGWRTVEFPGSSPFWAAGCGFGGEDVGWRGGVARCHPCVCLSAIASRRIGFMPPGDSMPHGHPSKNDSTP